MYQYHCDTIKSWLDFGDLAFIFNAISLKNCKAFFCPLSWTEWWNLTYLTQIIFLEGGGGQNICLIEVTLTLLSRSQQQSSNFDQNIVSALYLWVLNDGSRPKFIERIIVTQYRWLYSKRNYKDNENFLLFLGIWINWLGSVKNAFRFKNAIWNQNSPSLSSVMEAQNLLEKPSIISLLLHGSKYTYNGHSLFINHHT